MGLELFISQGLVSLMGGSMWVDSEVGKGSKFFFTITSQIGQLSMDATLAKMPFGNRSILFVDTLHDRTGVVDRIQELRLKPYVIQDPRAVADKAKCPHIDTIVVDSLSVVCFKDVFSTFTLMNSARQTETIREYEHLRQIPIVLLVPVRSMLYVLCPPCADSGACPGPSSLGLYVMVAHWHWLVS
jgi:osomolarity two-component system, sensor histidine kinase NIK1